MLILRDYRASDVEDSVRWFTTETEWLNWDSPWEEEEESTPETLRREWAAYADRVAALPEERVRRGFELEADGRHIGWIVSYRDMGYFEPEDDAVAIGLDIPEQSCWGRGYGAAAIRQFVSYLQAHGVKTIYTQTWSGNERMLHLAEKLGFREVIRLKDYRTVKGKRYDAITLRLES